MPKAGAVPTSIPYGTRGVFPAVVAQSEVLNQDARQDGLRADLERAMRELEAAIEARRQTQKLAEDDKEYIAAVKKYLKLKLDDKNAKLAHFGTVLKQLKKDREIIFGKLQSDFDQLKHQHETELTTLKATLLANQQKRNSLATVAALEQQLEKEMEEAEAALRSERTRQAQETTTAMAEYYLLHVQHAKEVVDAVEKEKEKNRAFTKEHLQETVFAMMREADQQIRELSAKVQGARRVVTVNDDLTRQHHQRQMERDLLQRDVDEQAARIARKDVRIRKLVDEIRQFQAELAERQEAPVVAEPETVADDAPLLDASVVELPPAESVESEPPPEPPAPVEVDPMAEFKEEAVQVLCDVCVKVLGEVDAGNAEDYRLFQTQFDDGDQRKRALRFLLAKLGNVVLRPSERRRLVLSSLDGLEGVDPNALNKVMAVRRKALVDFAKPIGKEEFPPTLSTHYFK